MIIQEIIRQILGRITTSLGSGPEIEGLSSPQPKYRRSQIRAQRVSSFPSSFCPAVVPVESATVYGALSTGQNYSQW